MAKKWTKYLILRYTKCNSDYLPENLIYDNNFVMFSKHQDIKLDKPDTISFTQSV